MNRSTSGFTIVELLIVIVVIGILAAITLVAFGGIRDRATHASIEQTVSSYRKALEAYAAEHGAYPVAVSTCLGEASVIAANGNCAHAGPGQPTAMANGLRTILTSLPEVDSACYAMYTGCRRNLSFLHQGTWQVDGELHPWYMIYYLPNKGKCNQPNLLDGSYGNFVSNVTESDKFVERDSTTGTTMCVIKMPTP